MAVEINHGVKVVVSRPALERALPGLKAVDSEPHTEPPKATPEAPAAQAAGQPGEKELSEAVVKLQDAVQIVRRSLEFHIDDSSGRVVVTVRDAESGETIRQIPPEEVLTLAESLEDSSSKIVHVTA